MYQCSRAGSLKCCNVGSYLECSHVPPHELKVVPREDKDTGRTVVKDLCNCKCGPRADGTCVPVIVDIVTQPSKMAIG